MMTEKAKPSSLKGPFPHEGISQTNRANNNNNHNNEEFILSYIHSL
jgi:hypothetical protein